jgi:hypothetical protein
LPREGERINIETNEYNLIVGYFKIYILFQNIFTYIIIKFNIAIMLLNKNIE